MTKNNRFHARAVSLSIAMRPVPILLALLLFAAGAAAHGPPAKRDQDFRLLADHNDDCGGDAATGLSNCNGTHDLIGLDLREAHDPALGDLVLFRFILNGGQGNLRDALTLKADGTTKAFELRTSNNADFQVTGFDTVTKAVPATNADGSQDGTRFVVEAGVRVATLGGAGVKLTEFRMESFTGSTRGDYMPGGYYNAVGVKVANPDQGDATTNFERTTGYLLQGPTYYVTATASPASVQAGTAVDVSVQLTNLLRSTAQTATLLVGATPGATAVWKDTDTATTTVDLSKGGPATAVLRLHGGTSPVAGTIQMTITTTLGGRNVIDVPYDVTAGTSTEATPTSPPDKDAPAPAAALTAFGLLAFAAAFRRR